MRNDLAGLRQALMARKMAVAPEEAAPIDPAMLAQFEGGAPPPDMPIDPGMGMDIPPEALLEIEKAKVKEMLKTVRGTELEQEIQALIQARSAEIDAESQELFQPQKPASKKY